MKRDEICWHSRDYCRDTISRGRMKMNRLTITLGRDREQDLSKMELAECWADSSMGATRVDRTGFERVWMEVQEYFEEDRLLG